MSILVFFAVVMGAAVLVSVSVFVVMMGAPNVDRDDPPDMTAAALVLLGLLMVAGFVSGTYSLVIS